MTPPRACRDLASTLIAHAAGLTSDSAAAGLIAAHHTWLARTDFTASHLHAGTRHDGHRYAWIDWQSAITALDTRQLSCTGTEAAILRIAASLADPGIAINLRDNLGSLDARNIVLVTDAIKAANG